jgi:hypothetical protein
MVKLSAVSTTLLCGLLGASSPAAADVVTDWNLIATQAVTQAGSARPGPSGLIDITMVQLAIHDAVQAYQGRFESYGPPIVGAAGSPVAAAAKAARDVLIGVGLTNTAGGSVDSIFNSYLALRGLGSDAGIAVGQQAAANMLTRRAGNDGRVPNGAEQFFGGVGAGEWRPTALTGGGQPAPMVAAYLRNLTPFVLTSASQFQQEPPPNLASGKYADEYDEVKAVGSLTGSSRRPSQTDLALFFADNTPLLLNRMQRGIADRDLGDIGDSARLLALVNTAMADALIVTWESKVHYNFWRPITAIRLGDSDGNDRTAGDPAWTPYITTPNYPEYSSGANALSGASTTMLANALGGDKYIFEVTSNFVHPVTGERPQNPRLYTRFSALADDVVDARIYEGIHFRSADEDARNLGKHVANWTFSHVLRQLH